MTTRIIIIVFLMVMGSWQNHLQAQEQDSILYSNTSFEDLLDVVKHATLSFDLPDDSFLRTSDPKVLISKKWTSKVAYRVTPIGFAQMIPTFQEKYVITSDRELLGQEQVTLHGRKGFVSKFRELQESGNHFIVWVVIFGDEKITFSASATYPEYHDEALESSYFQMMKNVDLDLGQ